MQTISSLLCGSRYANQDCKQLLINKQDIDLYVYTTFLAFVSLLAIDQCKWEMKALLLS